MRARSLDDDDVVLVAPFDEEVAGESSDSAGLPLASKSLPVAETNHNHIGHLAAHSTSKHSGAYTVSSWHGRLQLPDPVLVAGGVMFLCVAKDTPPDDASMPCKILSIMDDFPVDHGRFSFARLQQTLLSPADPGCMKNCARICC